jgi:hypothetical protein
MRTNADIQVYSIALSARVVRDRQRHARMPATNVKPRDEFAGLHRFATCRGLVSSRHRGVCRPVVTGFRLTMSEGSSIDLLSIHDYTRRPSVPAGFHVARLASRPQSSAPRPRLGLILKHRARVVAARSPQVHPQYGARTTAKH